MRSIQLIGLFLIVFDVVTAFSRIELTRKQVFKTPSHRSNASTNDPIKNYGNYFYTGEMLVNHEPYWVILDTGSEYFYLACDCWKGDVLGTKEGVKNYCKKTDKQFKCSESPTCRETGETFEIKFMEGYVNGYLDKDRVCLGDEDHCTDTSQKLGCASFLDKDAIDPGKDTGLLGLTWVSGTMGNSPMRSILQNKNCEEKVFAFFLNSQGDHKKSEMTICGSDPNHYKGDLNWFKVKKYENDWTLPLHKVKYGGKTVWKGTPIRGTILDTGTTDLIFPREVYYQIPKNKKGPCDLSRYKDLTLYIGHQNYSITPRDYLWFNKEDGSCEKMIDRDDDVIILGDVFMRKYYSIFDVGRGRIGLAKSQ